MNDFVFSSSFNLANMTCQLVELGSINPLKPISTSWNIKIAKLKLLSLRLGCFLASLQYPSNYALDIVYTEQCSQLTLKLYKCTLYLRRNYTTTVALIVHHSVAIIPMLLRVLLLLFKVSNDNVLCLQ